MDLPHLNERRHLATTTARAGAALTLLVVPVYHLIELFAGSAPDDLLSIHAAWRTPPLLAAAALMLLTWLRPQAPSAAWLLRALTLSIMAMMFGMFATDVLHEAGDPEHMVRGLIMSTFAISLLSLRGGGEVLLLFCVPLILCLLWLGQAGVDLNGVTLWLVDPVMMLAVAVIAAEIFYRMRERSFRLEARLTRLASVDALTGLDNRRGLERRLHAEMSRSRRHGEPLSIVIGDLDHFKRVNDEFGHGVGDEVLRAVGRRLRERLRSEDIAVRWGGEEFLLALPDTDASEAGRVAESLRSLIADTPVHDSGQDISVTISFGVAQLDQESSIDELVRRADRALYRAKREGRNRVCTDTAGSAGSEQDRRPSD